MLPLGAIGAKSGGRIFVVCKRINASMVPMTALELKRKICMIVRVFPQHTPCTFYKK